MSYIQAINDQNLRNEQNNMKQTLEEDEERHGELPRDRDTGKKVSKKEAKEGIDEKEHKKEENEEEDKDKDKDEEGKKKKKKNEDDDDDENGGGGLLMPVIEWIGKLFPRPVKAPVGDTGNNKEVEKEEEK